MQEIAVGITVRCIVTYNGKPFLLNESLILNAKDAYFASFCYAIHTTAIAVTVAQVNEETLFAHRYSTSFSHRKSYARRPLI